MIIGVDKHNILLYNNNIKKKRNPEGLLPEEEKDVEEGLREGWFAGVGMNGGIEMKPVVWSCFGDKWVEQRKEELPYYEELDFLLQLFDREFSENVCAFVQRISFYSYEIEFIIGTECIKVSTVIGRDVLQFVKLNKEYEACNREIRHFTKTVVKEVLESYLRTKGIIQ